MSSGSEDEFQSADEGSDVEDSECSGSASVHSQRRPECTAAAAAACERVVETEKDETQDEGVKEELQRRPNKDVSNIESVKLDTRDERRTEECNKAASNIESVKEDTQGEKRKEECNTDASKIESVKNKTRGERRKEERNKEASNIESVKDETRDEGKKEQLSKDVLNFLHRVSIVGTEESIEDICESVETLRLSEKCHAVENVFVSQAESKADSVSLSVSLVKGVESIEDKAIDQLEEDTGSSSNKESYEKSYVEVQEEKYTLESSKESDGQCLPNELPRTEKRGNGVEKDVDQPKEVIEDSGERISTTKHKLESLPQTATSENSKSRQKTKIKAENQDRQTKTENQDRQTKPENQDRQTKPENQDRQTKPENQDRQTKPENQDRQTKPENQDRQTKPENQDRQTKTENQDRQTKPENQADKIDDLVPDSQPKPVRQSKIGLKKPREKLGERLGTKRLGVKAATKPIDGISSSDAIKHKEEEENSRSKSANERGIQLISQNVGDSRGEEDRKAKNRHQWEEQQEGLCKEKEESKTSSGGVDKKIGQNEGDSRGEGDRKAKKRQQWEEQQERWHQALNLDKDRKEAPEDGDGWSAPWGGWGGTLLSAATSFTREVGRGVGTVMETVESSIGVPNPEVMAQEVCKEEQQDKVLLEELSKTPAVAGEGGQTKVEKPCGREQSLGGRAEQQVGGASYGLGAFSLGSLVSGVSGALETASSKVLMGGLDTLEVIGRKAMDVIQEGDPGLHRKRAFLANKKPNLSQALQEARQRAIEEEKEGGGSGRPSKNAQSASFEQAWEATVGPVHLEALSLVAKQCQGKHVKALLPHYAQDKLLRENNKIKSTCELEEYTQVEEGLEEVVRRAVVAMGLPLDSQKLVEAWSSVEERATLIQEGGLEAGAEGALYGTMAQLVAQVCALVHKGGELAIITPDTDPLHLAAHFKEVAQAVSCGLENVADQVCGAITCEGTVADAQVNNTITNIYLQAASGNNYIQQSLALVASVLQYSNTKYTKTAEAPRW